MEGLVEGFAVALSWQNLLFVTLGVTLGTIVGLLPGLGPTAAIALLLPLTYSLEPATAIIFLAGIYYGSMFGGRIPAILLNLPGDASSVVTTFDGYPLRQQGRAGPALGMTAIGSFIGGTIAIVGLTLFAPLVARWALRIGSPEMFALTLLGLAMIALLSSGGIAKGLLSAGIGILIAAIGIDMISGSYRFTLGVPELYDGIGIVPLAVGMFGLAELMLMAERRFRHDTALGKVGSVMPTRADWVQSRMAILRASLIGFVIGLLPGGGGTVSSVVAYGTEKRFSKNPELFGKGAMDGLAATETADNASSNSAFVPLLTLGVPPNPVLALIAGALLLHQVTPGPQLLTNHPDIFWGVIASMYIGSILLLILNLPMVGVFVQVLRVPGPILSVVIVTIAMAGVYSVRHSSFDILVTFIFAILGYSLRKAGISAGPLILGFILAPIMETHFRRSMIISGGELSVFVSRPISATLLALVVLLFLSLLWDGWRRRRKEKAAESVGAV